MTSHVPRSYGLTTLDSSPSSSVRITEEPLRVTGMLMLHTWTHGHTHTHTGLIHYILLAKVMSLHALVMPAYCGFTC